MSGIIVHEWLEPVGGAEKVVERFAALFPDAPIVSLWNDAPDRFPGERVRETWLSRTPLRRSKALALPFMPLTWHHLGRAEAEWIICSSHLFSHHARFSGPARDARKLLYVHTPARYIWTPDLDARGASPLARLASPILRSIDRKRAQEATSIVANSDFVKQRIERSWGREASVIHPPVDVADFAKSRMDELTAEDHDILEHLPRSYLLGVSRFVPYKRLDLVLRAGEAADLPVVLAGSGPEAESLQKLAGELAVSATFVDRPSHVLLTELYRRSLAFVFPAIEDFGIMPVEAMATGTPVIGRSIGGVAESVIDERTGFLLEEFAPGEIRRAVDKLTSLRREEAVARAWEFDRSVFDERIRRWVTEGP